MFMTPNMLQATSALEDKFIKVENYLKLLNCVSVINNGNITGAGASGTEVWLSRYNPIFIGSTYLNDDRYGNDNEDRIKGKVLLCGLGLNFSLLDDPKSANFNDCNLKFYVDTKRLKDDVAKFFGISKRGGQARSGLLLNPFGLEDYIYKELIPYCKIPENELAKNYGKYNYVAQYNISGYPKGGALICTEYEPNYNIEFYYYGSDNKKYNIKDKTMINDWFNSHLDNDMKNFFKAYEVSQNNKLFWSGGVIGGINLGNIKSSLFASLVEVDALTDKFTYISNASSNVINSNPNIYFIKGYLRNSVLANLLFNSSNPETFGYKNILSVRFFQSSLNGSIYINGFCFNKYNKKYLTYDEKNKSLTLTLPPETTFDEGMNYCYVK